LGFCIATYVNGTRIFFSKYPADFSVLEALVSSSVVVCSIELVVVGEVGLLEVPVVLVSEVPGLLILDIAVVVVTVVVEANADEDVSFLAVGKQCLGPESVDVSLLLWSILDFRKQKVPPNGWPGFSHVQ